MLKDFFNLFFPKLCLACNALLATNEEVICTACLYSFPQTHAHITPDDNAIAYKFYGKVAIQYALAYYKLNKESKLQHLIYQMKYKSQPQIAEFLGQRYGYILATTPLHSVFNMILPIPLHIKRLQQRGFNQSAFFAKGLSAALNIHWSEEYIIRTKNTPTQTKKDKITRFDNVKQSFYIDRPLILKKDHILLVDDIITTGATLEAGVQALFDAGVHNVSIAAIAVTDYEF